MRTAILFCCALAACTVEGKPDGPPAIVTCRDLRDGETFVYDTRTVRNIRIGIGSVSSFDFTDTEGRQRHARSDMEPYLKCVRHE